MQSYYVDEKLSDGVLLEATFPPPGLGYSAGSLPGWGRDKSLFALYPHMASCGSIIGDAGVGRVSPLGRHGVFIRYNLTRGDAAKVLEGIAMAAEIYFAAGARPKSALCARVVGAPRTFICLPTIRWAAHGWAPIRRARWWTPSGTYGTCRTSSCSTPRCCRPRAM